MNNASNDAKLTTASIVLFNTSKKQIDSVLEAIFSSGCISTLYIIDNSPNDWWRILEKRNPGIRYIHNTNLGYGASHNLAIKDAIEIGSKYHIVLNPDIFFEPNVLPSLIQFMNDHSDVGYILPKVTFVDGEIQYLCKLLPTPFDLVIRRFLPKTKYFTKSNDRYILRSSGYDKVINPPCLSGCFMFMRVETLLRHNIFFDDKYFMYCEDVDLIRRIHKVSQTLYYPVVTIIHNHEKASYKNRKMLFAHIRSAFRYFNKFGWFFDRERREWNKKILKEIGKQK